MSHLMTINPILANLAKLVKLARSVNHGGRVNSAIWVSKVVVAYCLSLDRMIYFQYIGYRCKSIPSVSHASAAHDPNHCKIPLKLDTKLHFDDMV